MIYTVECSHADPSREDEWNAFYSATKLPALISVTGFRTSQRFKAVTSGCPVYLAVHTVRDQSVLDGDEYHEKGGGNFARWQSDITDWRRNLYRMDGSAPPVRAGEALVLSSSGPAPLTPFKVPIRHLEGDALDLNPAYRWMSAVPLSEVPVLSAVPKELDIYLPMTMQLRPGETASPSSTGVDDA